ALLGGAVRDPAGAGPPRAARARRGADLGRAPRARRESRRRRTEEAPADPRLLRILRPGFARAPARRPGTGPHPGRPPAPGAGRPVRKDLRPGASPFGGGP